jgi:formylglycine-generating enzyme required for sulfatase activity
MNRFAHIFAAILICLGASTHLLAQNNARQLPTDTTIKVKNVAFKMILVQGGDFVQGASSRIGKTTKTGENPAHKVWLDSYRIGQTEVTQALWVAVMGSEPTLWGGWGVHGRGDDYPVYHVKWTDVQTFITRLNALTGLQFRLPTEAEWEFAARGGNAGAHSRFAGGHLLDKVAWNRHNGEGHTHPVAQKTPNALGLYDMSGNVWEWCEDWYANYNVGSQYNPKGPASGVSKVVRGGSWASPSQSCRVSSRDADAPDNMYDCVGFRLALSAPEVPRKDAKPRKFKDFTFRSGQYHIQGFAFDQRSQCLYLSTTTAIVKMALDGTVLGSVVGFKGHVGQVVLDTVTRKVYATLEALDDDLCNGMAAFAGYELFTRATAAVYIVEVDMDKITRLDIPEQEIVVKHGLAAPLADYKAEVTVVGKRYEHRYGVCGIDALAIGPTIGAPSDGGRYLYVSCAITLDTVRTDNDYNILLCYPLGDFRQPAHSYFIHTGNTAYGVQNMVWDAFRQRLHLFVYPGKKSAYPNYNVSSIDVTQPSLYAPLQGVPYATEPMEQLKVVSGSYCTAGAQGICHYDESRFLTAKYQKIDNHRYTTIKLFPKRKNAF